MTLKWDWEREYHIGRIDGGFYLMDDNGNALEGPFHRVEFAHVGFANTDHIKGHGEDGLEFMEKDGQGYDWPTNLSMEINIGDNL